MNRKLISALAGVVLSLTALPWVTSDNEVEAQVAVPTAPAPRAAAALAAPLASRPVPGKGFASAVTGAAGLKPAVLNLALDAVRCAVISGEIEPPPTLTVIDYSRPSTDPRLWVFDTATGDVLFTELVAHGRNTGDNIATAFSDTLNSRQSSIGLFVTDDTYVGSNGYSLRLDGLEPGFNGRARERAIVMHGAPYVNPELAKAQGRIGRSWGCPALREAVARQVIDTIRGGGVIFSYYPDETWLDSSRFLNCGSAA